VTASPGDVQVDHLVVGSDARAWAVAPRDKRPHRLPRVDARVGDGERALDARVQPRLARSASATSISSVGTPVSRSPRGTGRRRRVVVGRRDEQAARVLDAVGAMRAQDDVLLDALDRRRSGP
jgi:hypothetical protein